MAINFSLHDIEPSKASRDVAITFITSAVMRDSSLNGVPFLTPCPVDEMPVSVPPRPKAIAARVMSTVNEVRASEVRASEVRVYEVR